MKFKRTTDKILTAGIAFLLVIITGLIIVLTWKSWQDGTFPYLIILVAAFLLLVLLMLFFWKGTLSANNREQKIIRASRLYSFISQINQTIVKAKDDKMLFKEVCRIAVDTGKFRMAWIGLIDVETKKLIPVIHAGEEKDYLSKISISSVGDEPQGRGPTGTAIREGQYVFCNDIEKTPEMAPWKEAAIGRGYLSSISLPIKKFEKITGAFTLYAPVINFFNKEEIELLEEVTSDISFSLEVFEKDKLREKSDYELLESEKRYQTLTEVSPVGVFHTDAAGYTTYVNPRWCQIAGMSSKEALGNGWLNAVHADDKEVLRNGWQEATKNQHYSLSEYRFVHPDGSIVWVLGQATPERNLDNQIVGYVGTATDITERKKSEEEIVKLYRENETVLNRINDAMVSVDNQWRYTFLNDAALATHPLGKEETIGKVIWDVHPEMRGTVFWDKYHEAMETGKVVEVESFYAPMQTWFSVKVYPSHDGLTIFYTDVTARKNAEEKIIKSEIRLQKAQEIGKQGYWQLDLKTNMVLASKEAMRIYGFPAVEGELKREKIAARIIDKEKINEAMVNLVQYNKPYNIIIRINPADGTAMKYISALAEAEKNEKGEIEKIVGTLQDITESVNAQNEIIKEKNLSDSIINSLPGVFYLYNKEGKFLRWNKNFESVTMYEAGEIKQMHPLDFFATEDKKIVSQKIDNTFSLGEDNVQADFLLKSGEKIPYYFTGKAIEYEGSLCLMGVGIDFSERAKAQQKINETTKQLRQLTAHLQKIREEERKRIGREIHDELGQQLTAIKMDISWIDKKIPDESGLIKNKLKNVIGLLDGSNQSIRRILSELRPGMLENNSLIEAIDWLGKQFTGNTGIPVQFFSTEKEIKLSEPVATCVFRVYQEALTNIMRYAEAKKVWTSFTITNDGITLTIEDDGLGFDTVSAQSRQSFGILGMKERVASLDGKFELESTPGKGTKIIINLPDQS